MLNKIKANRTKIIFIVIFLIGFAMSTYPFVAGLFMSHDQSSIVQTYQSDSESINENEKEEILALANQYNNVLYQTNGAIVGDSENILNHDSYKDLLNISGNGVMGTLEIPKIDVDLPIYHGTEDDVLSIGVGHLEGTSLPVGGNSTHAVLTGHRGLPSSKLFTRLDEMEIGDFFYINVLDETLAYEVNDIEVIEPEEVDSLMIQNDQDLVSLVTCTPYGINTHRLVVTGERVPYSEQDKTEIQSAIPSIRELLFMILPFIFLGLLIFMIWKQRKENRNAKGNS